MRGAMLPCPGMIMFPVLGLGFGLCVGVTLLSPVKLMWLFTLLLLLLLLLFVVLDPVVGGPLTLCNDNGS